MLNSPNLAFALQMGVGLLGGGWLLLWSAYQEGVPRPLGWLDAYLGTLVGGLVGARAGYVLLHAARFAEHPSAIPRLWYGELAWQGAILGGLLAAVLMCRWRGLEFARFGDGLALALPLGWIGLCWAGRSVGLLVGGAVAEPQAHPGWQVGYVLDLSGAVLPRYELQLLGIALGLGLLIVAWAVTMLDWWVGRRLWLLLGLLSLVILLMDALSAAGGGWLEGVSALILGGVSLWGVVKRRELVVPQIPEVRL